MVQPYEKLEFNRLFDLINSKTASLAVIGSGYVGLPTAALFADAGFTVTAYDIKSNLVKKINNGESPIQEPGLQEILSRNVRNQKLKALLRSNFHLDQDVIIISVQTPVNSCYEPDLSFLMNSVVSVGQGLKKGQLIIICSTVPPGTIVKKIKPCFESLSNLISDEDFYLAYVPERISPGNAIKELTDNVRLVGGIGPNSTKLAVELFGCICKRLLKADATTAEIAKLAENTFRDVNIAFANQIALICEQQGADSKEVIGLANTHPRVNIHSPSPGVGGPCLTKDPYLLVFQSPVSNQSLVKCARKANNRMPKHIIKLVNTALCGAHKDVRKSILAVLGTSYKANVDDCRFSPSEPIIKELLRLGAEVRVYDPNCNEVFGGVKKESLTSAVDGADCILLLVDHDEFKKMNLAQLGLLMKGKPAIVDGKRIINPQKAETLGYIYKGIGYGKISTL